MDTDLNLFQQFSDLQPFVPFVGMTSPYLEQG